MQEEVRGCDGWRQGRFPTTRCASAPTRAVRPPGARNTVANSNRPIQRYQFAGSSLARYDKRRAQASVNRRPEGMHPRLVLADADERLADIRVGHRAKHEESEREHDGRIRVGHERRRVRRILPDGRAPDLRVRRPGLPALRGVPASDRAHRAGRCDPADPGTPRPAHRGPRERTAYLKWASRLSISILFRLTPEATVKKD